MHFCRNCHNDFDVIRRKPTVILCGHTFCIVCIQESLAVENKFECKNCTYVQVDSSMLIPNLILTDKNSMRNSNETLTRDTQHRPMGFFPLTNDHSQTTFAENQFQQMQSTLKRRGMDIDGPPSNQEMFDSLQNFNLRDSGNQHEQLHKCQNHLCSKPTNKRYCSYECSLDNNQRPINRTEVVTEVNSFHSLNRNVTPSRNRPFNIPSGPKSFSGSKQSFTIQKPKFGGSAFGKYNNSRCSRAGCLNNRHKGFGEDFWYCSLVCYSIVERKEWNPNN